MSDALDSARATLKTESAGLRLLGETLDARFDAAIDVLAGVRGRVIVSGMGKSGHIARKIAATLASTGTPSQFVHPAEASHGDLGMITENDVLLVLSFSGETVELRSVLDYAVRFHIPIIAITKTPQSALGQAAQVTLTLPDAEEACPNGLAPTTSTLMQLALGDAIAVALLERNQFTAHDFKRFHPKGRLGAALTSVQDLMHPKKTLPLIGDVPIRDAIPLMNEKGFGCLGVIDTDGRLCGIITDGDLRRHILSGNILDKTTYDIMTNDPKCITRDCAAAHALNIMEEHKIQCIFVCENKVPHGIIRILDLVQHGAA